MLFFSGLQSSEECTILDPKLKSDIADLACYTNPWNHSHDELAAAKTRLTDDAQSRFNKGLSLFKTGVALSRVFTNTILQMKTDIRMGADLSRCVEKMSAPKQPEVEIKDARL